MRQKRDRSAGIERGQRPAARQPLPGRGARAARGAACGGVLRDGIAGSHLPAAHSGIRTVGADRHGGTIRAYSPQAIQAAAFSAIIKVGALVLPLVIIGITPASTTRRPRTPRAQVGALLA